MFHAQGSGLSIGTRLVGGGRRGLIVLILLLLAVPAFADGITIQGRLTDATSGQPVSGTSATMTFKIYPPSGSGTPLWEEVAQGVTMTNGIFSYVIGTNKRGGSAATFPEVFTSGSVEVEVTVNTHTLTERIPISDAGVASALRSGATTLTAANILRNDQSGTISGSLHLANGLTLGGQGAALAADGTLKIKQLQTLQGKPLIDDQGALAGSALASVGRPRLPRPAYPPSPASDGTYLRGTSSFLLVPLGDRTVTHGLNLSDPERSFVDLTFWSRTTGLTIQREGLDDSWFYPNFWPGTTGSGWSNLTAGQVTLTRGSLETVYDYHNIRIWRLDNQTGFPLPDFASSLQSIARNNSPVSVQLPGLQGRDVNRLLVRLLLWSSTKGFHGLRIGGDSIVGDDRGIHWDSLTTDPAATYSLRVTRHPADIDADKFKVQVWDYGSDSSRLPPPDFDSGFIGVPVSNTPFPVYHGLGASPSGLLVDMTFLNSDNDGDPNVHGIHIDGLGGDDNAGVNDQGGGWWQNLTSDSVELVVGQRPENDGVRIRIWRVQ